MVWFLYGTIEPDVVHVNQDIFIICFYKGFCHEVFDVLLCFGRQSVVTVNMLGFCFGIQPGFNVRVFFCHCWSQDCLLLLESRSRDAA